MKTKEELITQAFLAGYEASQRVVKDMLDDKINAKQADEYCMSELKKTILLLTKGEELND